MIRSDFHFDLPDALIAAEPPAVRGDSRMLCLQRGDGRIEDRHFLDLPGFLRSGDLLVFNDTRVIPARLFGQKESGGKVEILVERLTSSTTCMAHMRASKAAKTGTRITVGPAVLRVTGRDDALFSLAIETGCDTLSALMDSCGHMPLPPYIKRADADIDRDRYQTVYARHAGAVAAPTAGLHFTPAVLEALAARGVRSTHVTLHVGAGTFQPVKVDQLDDHRMHSEWLRVSDDTVRMVRETRAAGGRVIAVGTTSVRSLESASASGTLEPFEGETRIFIRPGYSFKTVDGLLTNFHLPESTLIMLVSAFAGHEATMAAYRHAVNAGYRFFSYGDAMLILGELP